MKTQCTPRHLWMPIIAFLLSVSIAKGQYDDVGFATLSEEETFVIDGLSSIVLPQGRIELNAYSSLFSVWQATHQSTAESPIIDRRRLTEFNTALEAYYGFSESGRWDMGARIRYGKRRLDNAAQNSPFKIFAKNEVSPEEETREGLDYNYSGVREVGIRFRLMPFESVPQLTLNAGYSFVPNHEEEVQEHLVADRNSFDFNLAYYVGLNGESSSSSFYYFFLRGIAYQSSTIENSDRPKSSDQWLYDSSASFFIVQRLGRLVVYPGLSYGITYKPPAEPFQNRSLIKLQEQVLGILGAQYQPSPGLSFNISTSIPFLLKRPNSYVREVRESYSFVSIGGRLVF